MARDFDKEILALKAKQKQQMDELKAEAKKAEKARNYKLGALFRKAVKNVPMSDKIVAQYFEKIAPDFDNFVANFSVTDSAESVAENKREVTAKSQKDEQSFLDAAAASSTESHDAQAGAKNAAAPHAISNENPWG